MDSFQNSNVLVGNPGMVSGYDKLVVSEHIFLSIRKKAAVVDRMKYRIGGDRRVERHWLVGCAGLTACVLHYSHLFDFDLT